MALVGDEPVGDRYGRPSASLRPRLLAIMCARAVGCRLLRRRIDLFPELRANVRQRLRAQCGLVQSKENMFALRRPDYVRHPGHSC